MWEQLVCQSLVFFLFFHPHFLSLRRVFRWALLGFALGVSVLLMNLLSMDPFAWLYLGCGILLTSILANKAMHGIFASRELIESKSLELSREEARVGEQSRQKTREIETLQDEIQRVSELYESVKEMSGALEQPHLFVALAEAMIKNFSLQKIRMMMLKIPAHGKPIIDKVFEIDPRGLMAKGAAPAVLSKDLIREGEIFPSDHRIVEWLQRNPQGLKLSNEAQENAPPDEDIRTALLEHCIVHPVTTDKGLQAVLWIEGTRPEDASSLSILIDRFGSEYRRIRLYEEVQELAITDWLTRLYVRRFFFKRLEEEISRCQRFHLKFSFLMIDIDDFKTYNDRYGHLVGDALLKRIAQIIKHSVREVDLVARYGGEEFAAILLDTDSEGAVFVGQRIRRSIEKEQFKVYDEEITLTVSIGVATYTPKIQEGSGIVEWADSALYQAKRQGKNRVCVYL